MENKTIIDTENLLLRYFSMNDAEKVYSMSIEEGMKKWIPDQVYKNLEEAEEVIEYLCSQYLRRPDPRKSPFVLGIELKNNNELIGHIGLSPLEDDVEIGYAIEDKHQGKGYATEAVKAMSEWALKSISLSSVLAVVASENANSCRVLEKAGYGLIEEKEREYLGSIRLCRLYRIML